MLLLLGLGRQLFASPLPLHVSGKQLVNSSGCVVRLIGVDVDSMEWNALGYGPWSNGNGITATVQEAISYWNVNCIRLPLSQDFWNGTSNSKSTVSSAAAYQSLVDTVVTMCNSANIYVDLDLHWSGTGSYGTATQQDSMPDSNSPAFWQSLAARYANNPSVLFDLYNEPYPNTWQVWRWGGNANEGFTTPGLQVLLGDIRATAFSAASPLASAGSNGYANNVCIAGGLAYSYNFANDQSCQPFPGLTDTAQGNGVIYAAHIYNNKGVNAATPATVSGGNACSGGWNSGSGWTNATNNGGWDYFIGPAGALGPVLVEEFGDMNSGDNSGNSFCIPVVNYINANGYSALCWDLNTVAGPELIQGWSTTLGAPCSGCNWNLTSYEGQTVYGWLTSTTQAACSVSSDTPTPTATRTATATASPTASSSATPSPSATPSRTATQSRTPTPSASPSLSASPSPSATGSVTASPSSTASGTVSLTPSPSGTPSVSPTGTPSRTPSPSPSASPTASPTLTPSASSSASRTASPSATVTSTFSPVVGTPSVSPSASPTPTVSPAETPTPSFTSTPTVSVSPSSTVSPSATRSATATASPSVTPTASPSASPSQSPSQSATASASASASASPSVSVTLTVSPITSPTGTSSPTLTLTPSPVSSSTRTATASPTPSLTPVLPVLSTLSPVTLSAGTAQGLTLTGANFVAASQVSVNGALFTPVFEGAGQLFLQLPALAAGNAAVLVVNPGSLSSSAQVLVIKGAAASPDPTAGGGLKIVSISPIPNPNPRVLAVQMEGPADSISATVFTKAEVVSLEFEQGQVQAGWNQVALPAAWQSLPNGLYYVRLQAIRGGQRSPLLLVKVVVLR